MSESDVPQIITKSARSLAASQRHARERQKKQKHIGEKMSSTITAPIKAWVYHAEWVALMSVLIGCFLFCYRESVHTNDRLDSHMEAINRRSDELSRDLNKRNDDLHKEFYSLLKEMHKS